MIGAARARLQSRLPNRVDLDMVSRSTTFLDVIRKDGIVSDQHQHCGHDHAVAEPARPVVKDPVCGMTVDPDRTEHHHRYGGNLLYCDGRVEKISAIAPFSLLATQGVTLLNPKQP